MPPTAMGSSHLWPVLFLRWLRRVGVMAPRETFIAFMFREMGRPMTSPFVIGVGFSLFVCGFLPAISGGDKKESKYLNPGH